MPNRVVIKKRADFKQYVNNNTYVIVVIRMYCFAD